MSIKNLTLINFQIHKHLFIELDKEFTVITGGNNLGKSSIIRAMYWLIYNEPSGDWMRRINKDGELENTTVKMVFEDGTIIKRTKGDGINKYKVDDEEYENFGYNVPEQVLQKLKIFPLVTNKDSFNLNISMQEDKPFLVFESSTVRASVLDTLTGNSLVQKCISSFNKESLTLSKDISTYEKHIRDNEDMIEGLPDIEAAEKIIKEIDIKEKTRLEKVLKLKLLESKRESLIRINKILDNYKEVNIDVVYSLQELKEQKEKKLVKIQGLKTDYTKYKKNKNIILPDIESIHILKENIIFKKSSLSTLITLKRKAQDFKSEIELNSDSVAVYEKQLEDFYKQNPLCPTCSKPWSKK